MTGPTTDHVSITHKYVPELSKRTQTVKASNDVEILSSQDHVLVAVLPIYPVVTSPTVVLKLPVVITVTNVAPTLVHTTIMVMVYNDVGYQRVLAVDLHHQAMDMIYEGLAILRGVVPTLT